MHMAAAKIGIQALSVVFILSFLCSAGCDGQAVRGREVPPNNREQVNLGPKAIQLSCDNVVTWTFGEDIATLAAALRNCGGTSYFRYAGPIDTDTVEFLRVVPTLAQQPQARVIFLNIDSTGGAVREAMEAGRLIWDRPILVSVPADSDCLSACIFVATGARLRSLNGHIGIHRVFTADASIRTPTELRAASAGFEVEAREYFQEFGVNTEIVDMMMSTPSSTIRYLSEDELNQYGLGPINVSLRELSRLDVVRQCGVAYEQRVTAAEAEWNRRCPADLEMTRSSIPELVAEEARRLGECKAAIDREFQVSSPADCR